MPLKDPEARKAYLAAYYQKNKETLNLKRKNDLEHKAWDRERMRRIRETPEGKKYNRLTNWKKWGVVGDHDAIYEIYLETTNCMKCSIQFSDGNWKCMDHDHETGEYRAVLCNRCNTHNPLDKKI